MALTNCKECNAEVSDSAFKCPQCAFQLRKPKRSIMGKLFKWFFILFNIFMAIWLFLAMAGAGDAASTAVSEAEKVGTAIGATLGLGMLLSVWVIGDIILGLLVLFTRPKG